MSEIKRMVDKKTMQAYVVEYLFDQNDLMKKPQILSIRMSSKFDVFSKQFQLKAGENSHSRNTKGVLVLSLGDDRVVVDLSNQKLKAAHSEHGPFQAFEFSYNKGGKELSKLAILHKKASVTASFSNILIDGHLNEDDGTFECLVMSSPC